jgi:Protein of unknown function (DUF3574)
MRSVLDRVALVLAATLAVTACASSPPPVCGSGLSHRVEAELFFGRNVAGRGEVGDADWRQFLNEEVTPRFPAGFSVADVSGQWRSDTGAIISEHSKKLTVVLSGSAEEEASLAAIRDVYKERFNQDSVLIVETPVCAGF